MNYVHVAVERSLRTVMGRICKDASNDNKANIPEGFASDDEWDGRIMVNGSRSTSGSGFTING